LSDNPKPPPPKKAATPEIRAAQRWNIVWVVPVIALLLGAWLLYRNFAAQGPSARIRFDTADGIVAGKTEVRCRSVKVGVVKKVKLADDLKSVMTYLEMDSEATNLLRTGTRFWVVRPRFSVTELSGVDTLITGPYIELDPGPPGGSARTDFIGLESPSATSHSVPGQRLVLTANETGSLSVGSPIYYRGFEVGRIEGRRLERDGAKVTYDVFISEEYSQLVRENTQFWNTSGVDISAGSEGFKLRTPSLQAMLSGGVSFGVTSGEEPGNVAQDGMNFPLYPDEDAARHSAFDPRLKYLLLFDQTVRGLTEKSTVEFRGIMIGRVAGISFDLAPATGDTRIPVLIEIDPALMWPENARNMTKPDAEFLKDAVANGLRAALKTGSLLTGSLFVDLDYYEDAAPAKLGISGEYITIPTVSSGFAQMEAKLSAILDKIQALPIDRAVTEFAAAASEAKTTLAESRTTLKEIETTMAAARKTLENPQFRELPADLRKTLDELQKSVASMGPDGAVQGDLLRTLDELRAALRSMKMMTTTIEDKPNSLIFGRESSGNPTPKAPRRSGH